jgi:hypothetical protein
LNNNDMSEIGGSEGAAKADLVASLTRQELPPKGVAESFR